MGPECKFGVEKYIRRYPTYTLFLDTAIYLLVYEVLSLDMSTPNPTEGRTSTPPVSSKTFHVAGILTTVYGLDEVPEGCRSISCLWLLHGRLQKAEVMAHVAHTCLRDWHQRASSDHSKVGFVAIAFDQRNHGTREVYSLANKSWKEGNDNHAQDMYRYNELSGSS